MRYERTQEKNVEVLFDFKTDFDKKSKLLLCKKNIPSEFIKAIEDGEITTEALDSLDFPIRKYMTQITIHGVFPNIDKIGYSYRFVFKNKNGSVGVKWQAIDNKKRRRIAKYLKHQGIGYYSNSTTSGYTKTKMITKENYAEALTEMQELLAKSKKVDFYGGSKIYVADVYGTKFLVFNMTINGILEKNVQPLLDNFGCTVEFCKEKDIEKEAEDKAWRDKWANEKAEELRLENNLRDELLALGYKDKQVFKEDAIFFNAEINYNNEKVFTLCKRYKKSTRARCYHISYQEFKTYAEMIAWSKENEPTPSYSDRKLRQGFTSKGFLIK